MSRAPTAPPRIDHYRANDGRSLAVRVWNPAEQPLARVVFLHGITSHGGWYHGTAQQLADAGFEVDFLDRRGSGLNAEARGDVAHWQQWIDDVVTYLEQSRHALPIVLCGISWGGKLAVAVARQQPSLLRGLGLLCPGVFSLREPGPARNMVIAIASAERFEPLRVTIPLRDPALFTNNPRWQEFIARDPMALREVTWRFVRADRQLTRCARQSPPFVEVPMLLMLAGRERITDNRRTRAFFDRVASPHKALIEYPDAAHTLEFETDPAPYFADLTEWIRGAVHPDRQER